MDHECPICQLECLLEPVRQNAVGERRARKAGAVVRPRCQSATGELAGLFPSASSAPLPALQSAVGDAVGEGAQNLRILRVQLDGLAQQHLGAFVIDLGLSEIRR